MPLVMAWKAMAAASEPRSRVPRPCLKRALPMKKVAANARAVPMSVGAPSHSVFPEMRAGAG